MITINGFYSIQFTVKTVDNIYHPFFFTLIINTKLFTMSDKQSALDKISELREVLDEAQSNIDEVQNSLQEFAEQVMNEMDGFVPVDEQLFIDENDTDRNDLEAEQAWTKQYIEQTIKFLETELHFKVIRKDDITVSSDGNSVNETATETKAEDNVIEEKKSEDTSSFSSFSTCTLHTLCGICRAEIDSTSMFQCDRCKKQIHNDCYEDLVKAEIIPKCPTCRHFLENPNSTSSSSSSSDSFFDRRPVQPVQPVQPVGLPLVHGISLKGKRPIVPIFRNSDGNGYHYYTPSGAKAQVTARHLQTFQLFSSNLPNLNWDGTGNVNRTDAVCQEAHNCTYPCCPHYWRQL